MASKQKEQFAMRFTAIFLFFGFAAMTAIMPQAALAIGSDALRIVVQGTTQDAPCDYFHPNGDGTWWNRFPITIIVTETPQTNTPGVIMRKGSYDTETLVFRPGIMINGVDLVAQFESECGNKK